MIETIDVLSYILYFGESIGPAKPRVLELVYIAQRDALIGHNYRPVKIEIRIRIVEQQWYENSVLLDTLFFTIINIEKEIIIPEISDAASWKSISLFQCSD